MEYFRTCENTLVDFANTSVGQPRAAAGKEPQIQLPLASHGVYIRHHYQFSKNAVTKCECVSVVEIPARVAPIERFELPGYETVERLSRLTCRVRPTVHQALTAHRLQRREHR